MESNINIHEIIEQARRERSVALGNMIASGAHKSVSWLLDRAHRLMHAVLMTPANSR